MSAASSPQPTPKPSFMTAEQVNDQRMILVVDAGAKVGKSTFGLSSVDFLRNAPDHPTEPGLGLTPEQVLIGYIDCDRGISRILNGMGLSPEWKRRILFPSPPPASWTELTVVTDYLLEALVEHAKQYPQGAWFIVDNVEPPWLWLRDDFVRSAYEQSLVERMTEKRTQAESEGKTNLPTLSPQGDYGVANIRYNVEWMDKIKASGVNVIILGPTKTGTEKKWNPVKKSHDAEEPFTRIAGNKSNEYHGDFIIRLHKAADGQRAFEMVGGRFNKGAEIPNQLFRNPNLSRVVALINKINASATGKVS